MIILGIIAYGQNPAAGLLVDGKITAFAEEERFTRLKQSNGMFPGKAVSYCLAHAGLHLEDVDKIAFGWDCDKYPMAIFRNYTANYLKYKKRQKQAFSKGADASSVFTAFDSLIEYHPSKIRSRIVQDLRGAGLSGDVPETVFVPHHLAHAYSTFYCSGFDEAGILTLDGSGEDICTQLSIGAADGIRIVDSTPIPHSLGWFYAAVTQYLGFLPYRDEGKLMGLAALGECRKNTNKWLEPLSKILKIGKGCYEVDPIYTKFGGHYYGGRFTDAMAKMITGVDAGAVPIMYGEKAQIDGRPQSKYLVETYIDIAWAAQELLERAALTLAEKLVRDMGQENLCMSGGVGLNCKMNGEVLRQSGCKNIFVQPASSDAGTALGAAMHVAREMGDDVRNPLDHVYFGPEYTNDEIRTALTNCKLDFRRTDNTADEAAALIEQGKIIGWFQGRMEFGPRALGGRSILANPVFPDIKDKVNEQVKYRESWRPFCPSMIYEKRDDYLADANEASFMIVAYHLKEDMKEKIPCIVHVDGTVRPQAVTREANPLYHELISNLGKRTGHPVVLNTSFNVRGEPIVCHPLEAVRCFFSSGLDALVIGDFVVEK